MHRIEGEDSAGPRVSICVFSILCEIQCVCMGEHGSMNSKATAERQGGRKLKREP